MSTFTHSNDPGRGPMVMAIVWTLTGLALAVVAARAYVRHKVGGLMSDDWIMLAALLSQLMSAGFITAAFCDGLGRHDVDLSFDQLTHALKWGWCNMIVGAFATELGRISSAVFLHRLFSRRRWFKWFIIIFTIIQVIAGAVLILVTFLGTRPVQALWNPLIKAKRLKPEIPLYTAYTAQSILAFGDLSYVLLPSIIIWNLQMPFTQRVSLVLLMCLSLLTTAASIAKAVTVMTTSQSVTEPQYVASLSAMWSSIEQTLVIIIASVPPLRAAKKIKSSVFIRVHSSITSYTRRFGSKFRSTQYSADMPHSDLEEQTSDSSYVKA